MKRFVKSYIEFLKEQKENECKAKPGDKIEFTLNKKDKEPKIGYVKQYLLDGRVRITDMKGAIHDLDCNFVKKAGINENASSNFSEDKIKNFLENVYGEYDSYSITDGGVEVFSAGEDVPAFYSNSEIDEFYEATEENFELNDDGFTFDDPIEFNDQGDMDFYFKELVKKYNVAGVYRGSIGRKYEFPIEAKAELDALGITWYTIETVTNPDHEDYGKKYIDVTYKLSK